MSYNLRPTAGAPHSGAAPSPLHESSKLTDEELSASEALAILQSEASSHVGCGRKDTTVPHPLRCIEIKSGVTVTVDSYHLSQHKSDNLPLSPQHAANPDLSH